MSFTRRTLLLGAGSGLSLLVLTACTEPSPAPKPSVSPRPTDLVPTPSSFLRSNWTADPYARGATSYLQVGALPQARETLREPLLDRVFLAGEALADEPGTVRGALDSGASTARRLLEVAGDADRIAVVGAGAAGAEAARVLSAWGKDVVVIEARDRTGGRIDSRVNAAEASVELGAWRLSEGADDELISRLGRAGVEVTPLAGATAFGGDAVVEVAADDTRRATVATALTAALDWAKQQPTDVSIADAIEQSGVVPDDDENARVVQQLLAELASATGASPGDSTSWFLAQQPGDAVVVPTGPLGDLVDETLDEIEPVLSTVVVGVFYDEERVSLRLGTGESLAVDRVILTVPLGVLQKQSIEFDPPLPLLHRSALEQLSVGASEVVVLDYTEPFWSTEAVLWFSEDAEAAVRLWVNLQPLTGQNTLVGLVGGEAAVAVSDLDDDDLLSALRAALEPFVAAAIPPQTN